MSERASLLRPPILPEVAASDRLTHGRPVLAVVDALPGAPIAPYLANAPGAIRVRIVLRHKAGFDRTTGGAAAHPEALLAAAADVLGSLPPHALVIAEGAPLLTCLSPRFAILGTLSPSLLGLDPDVRALRSRFDLVLYDFRPGVLDRIQLASRA